MKVKDGEIGFTLVSEGWHGFEVGEEIKFVEQEGEATSTLQIGNRVIGDEEEGALCSIFCPLDKRFGKEKLCKIIHYTGLDKKIEKAKGLDPDMDITEWAKFVDIDTAKGNKFVQGVIVKLPGHRFKGEVKISKGRDKREFRNINKLDFYSGVDKKVTGPEEEQPTKKEAVQNKGDEDAGW